MCHMGMQGKHKKKHEHLSFTARISQQLSSKQKETVITLAEILVEQTYSPNLNKT